jgi:hypothetical protein
MLIKFGDDWVFSRGQTVGASMKAVFVVRRSSHIFLPQWGETKADECELSVLQFAFLCV